MRPAGEDGPSRALSGAPHGPGLRSPGPPAWTPPCPPGPGGRSPGHPAAKGPEQKRGVRTGSWRSRWESPGPGGGRRRHLPRGMVPGGRTAVRPPERQAQQTPLPPEGRGHGELCLLQRPLLGRDPLRRAPRSPAPAAPCTEPPTVQRAHPPRTEPSGATERGGRGGLRPWPRADGCAGPFLDLHPAVTPPAGEPREAARKRSRRSGEDAALSLAQAPPSPRLGRHGGPWRCGRAGARSVGVRPG